MTAKAKFTKVDVKLKFPFVGELTGTWEADEAQQRAAWELHVELVTRIAVVKLPDDEGLLREALSSLHSLFATTREILRRNGPEVARPSKVGRLTFATIAVAVLNAVLRPVLAKWHPLLQHHEASRPAAKSIWEHERDWSRAAELREVLAKVRPVVRAYAELLATGAGVPSLIDDTP
jgi:hypothetical protein